MQDRIVVIGGYGTVGQVVCRSLAGKFPGRIYAAGRNIRKAEAFSSGTNGTALPLRMDVTAPDAVDSLDSRVRVIVMCIDQQKPDFVQTCLQRGIHYIDVTANHPFNSQLLTFHHLARKAGATAVLGVGLAPGLTSLLARYSCSFFDKTEHADLFILLGSGEAHGEAALAWTFANMHHDCRKDRKTRQGFVDLPSRKQTDFGRDLGKRYAIPFNFLERHVLPQTLGIGSVDTWIAFDSAAITLVFMLSTKLSFPRPVNSRWFQKAMMKLNKKMHFGSDRYVVKVDIQGRKELRSCRYEASISGAGESHATGVVTAEVAEQLMIGSFAPGVFYMEQKFELQDFLENLRKRGLTFEFSETITESKLPHASS